jgi:uncharacterized protein (TIGR00369 family)
VRTPQEIFASVPFNRHLDWTLARCDDDGAVVEMAPRPEHLQEGNVVHGGLLSALADTTAAYALMTTLSAERTMTGVEFKMNFLRPATLDGGTLRATGRVVRRGRSLAVCEVSVAQADSEVALGLFTFLYLPRAARPGLLDAGAA